MDGVRHDYTYASGQLLRESFTQGGTAYTLDFLYDPDGRPYLLYLTTTTGSTTVSAPYYYILNLQGDVIHLVNTSGAAVASYTYDPYGSPLTATGSLAAVNPLRYRGYYYDTITCSPDITTPPSADLLTQTRIQALVKDSLGTICSHIAITIPLLTRILQVSY